MRQSLLWLRVEALVALGGGVLIMFWVNAYERLPVWAIILVLAAPDLSIAGYRVGPKFGAWVYNLAHSYAVPAMLGLAALYLLWTTSASDVLRLTESVLQIVLLWIIHISADRVLGFGLKESSGFKHTHLSRKRR